MEGIHLRSFNLMSDVGKFCGEAKVFVVDEDSWPRTFTNNPQIQQQFNIGVNYFSEKCWIRVERSYPERSIADLDCCPTKQ